MLRNQLDITTDPRARRALRAALRRRGYYRSITRD